MHSMKKVLRDFLSAEDGLVTVEWVALASALVVGAIAVGWLVLNGLQAPAGQIAATITTSAGSGGTH